MEIKEILKALEDKLYSEGMVKQLVTPEVTDYERGRIYGQIEILGLISRLTEEDLEDEDSDIQ